MHNQKRVAEDPQCVVVIGRYRFWAISHTKFKICSATARSWSRVRTPPFKGKADNAYTWPFQVSNWSAVEVLTSRPPTAILTTSPPRKPNGECTFTCTKVAPGPGDGSREASKSAPKDATSGAQVPPDSCASCPARDSR